MPSFFGRELLFALVLALSVIGFRIAEDEALSAGTVGDLIYYSVWVLPTLEHV